MLSTMTSGAVGPSAKEREFYEREAERDTSDVRHSGAFADISRVLARDSKTPFPNPAEWIDALYDCTAQWIAYCHIAPSGRRVLQLGGKGNHAVKFLLAGATEAWLLTPIDAEATFAKELAAASGVADRFHCEVGIAEDMPFADRFFDAIYCGGCIHHTDTRLALPEIHRVLAPAGQFAAVEPWRAALYGLGIRLFGKREPVPCSPLDEERIAPIFTVFGHAAKVSHHGALFRYPLVALSRLGLQLPFSVVWRVMRADDCLSSEIPAVRRQGGSVALLASRPN